MVDDLVLRRNDGVPAYNLAVVVDDADQGVEEVVRGDDLLTVHPAPGPPRRPARACRGPTWAHVPLVLGPDGERLAKRHGAVTLADLARRRRRCRSSSARSWPRASASPTPASPSRLPDLLARFDPARIPLTPWTYPRR